MSLDSDQFSLIDLNDSYSFESNNIVKLYQSTFDNKKLEIKNHVQFSIINEKSKIIKIIQEIKSQQKLENKIDKINHDSIQGQMFKKTIMIKDHVKQKNRKLNFINSKQSINISITNISQNQQASQLQTQKNNEQQSNSNILSSFQSESILSKQRIISFINNKQYISTFIKN